MARISQISLKQVPEKKVLSTTKAIDFSREYAGFTGEVYENILSYLKEKKLETAGPPFVIFHNMDLKELVVEAGFPVAQKLESKDGLDYKIQESVLVVSAIDLGPYEESDPTMMELFQWIEKNNYEMAGPIIYNYLNDTKRNESNYLTQIEIAVKKKN